MTTLTPHAHAQRTAAHRTVTGLLEEWGSPHAEHRAHVICQALTEQHQWGPPTTAADEPVPPRRPAVLASDQAREAAMAQIRATLARDKEHPA